MKPQVIMSKWNGNLAVAIPVYTIDELENDPAGGYCANDYKVSLHYYDLNNPIGFMLDADFSTVEFCNKKTLDKNVEWLGDL